MKRIAIVGGGPGGLFTARHIEDLLGSDVSVSILEASPRLGGKIVSDSFAAAGATFEAGVAELYDYSAYALDPLKILIGELGLETIPMAGPAVLLGDTVVQDFDDLAQKLGNTAAEKVAQFYNASETLYSPSNYYDGHFADDNLHPWASKTFRDILDEIGDDVARAYIETAVHTDVATEPHLTSALNGLKNVLMEDPRYMSVYTVKGGIERIVERLREQLKADIRLNHRVTAVARCETGYELTVNTPEGVKKERCDFLVMALPDYWLSQIQWQDRELAGAMRKHIAHYDRPAHYLRITGLFREPFWRPHVSGSYFMSDALGGCCLYDDASRYPSADGSAVLSWLVAGTPALVRANLSDRDLIAEAVASLSGPLAAGRDLLIEGRVHRWVGTINGLPGGSPTHDTKIRHRPASDTDPNLFMVGDYLYDSTLNGVFDSADYVASVLLTSIRKEEYEIRMAAEGVSASNGHSVPNDYFEEYASDTTYNESFEEYFCEDWTCDLIETVWGHKTGYKILDCGSANGLTLERFERKGVEAWGIENNQFIHTQTPAKWTHRNLLGDACNLPFPDNSFDFVYETCLCYLPPELVDKAIQELFRVCRIGVYCGSIATDMVKELIAEEDLLYGVRTYATMLEWAEHYQRNGFKLAIGDPDVLKRMWQIEVDANEGYYTWYPSADVMRNCFFSKPDVPILSHGSGAVLRSSRVLSGARPGLLATDAA